MMMIATDRWEILFHKLRNCSVRYVTRKYIITGHHAYSEGSIETARWKTEMCGKDAFVGRGVLLVGIGWDDLFSRVP